MYALTDLMPHQAVAAEKLMPVKVGGLFMEMGTGKTRTAIELAIRRRYKIRRVVWFCPVSIKETIRREIMKHTDARPDDIHVFNGWTNVRTVPDVFWYIAGIESMSSSARTVFTVNALVDAETFAIVDESTYIKGHRSKRTERLTAICKRARYRLILTGTPLTQGVVDLFAQMRFLSPKILGYSSFYSFAHNHLEYSDKYRELIVRAHNTEYLAARVKPYVYQVTKSECLTLPDKIRDSRWFEMTREQREWYLETKREMLMDIDYDDFDSITIFRLFSALQQVVSGFLNIDQEKRRTFLHNRINTLLDVVENLAGEQVIIWAKFEYDILSIRDALAAEYGEDQVCLFYGKLNERLRNESIDRFRSGARFLVATPASGGHGLTLNEAAYVVFYNNGFKYSERIQAEDRSHRIGQERKVTYIDLVCSDSIDERIMSALAGKKNVVEAFKAEIEKVKKDKIKDLIKVL